MMKKWTSIAACALLFAMTQVQANGLTTEPTATAYWNMPFGASKVKNEQPSFGFRMDQVIRDDSNPGVSSQTMVQKSVVDFRFNTSGIQGIYVRGVNMATPAVMKMGLSEGIVFLGATAVIATVAIIDMNNNDAPATCSTPTFALNVQVCNGFAGNGFNGVDPGCCPV